MDIIDASDLEIENTRVDHILKNSSGSVPRPMGKRQASTRISGVTGAQLYAWSAFPARMRPGWNRAPEKVSTA
jgi:hypothetical protein